MANVIEKKRTLFSQCDILIQKVQDHLYRFNGITHTSISFERGIKDIKDDRVVCRVGKGGRMFKCISPLGFYYYKDASETANYKKYEDNGIREKYMISFKGGYYELSYISSFNGTQIGHETRPWDLSGNGMPDHFIKDLEKVINGIIDYMIENKYDNESVQEFKTKVFIDLFGSVDGVKTQTNDNKILSHGFDLKTSFRKRKFGGINQR